MFESSSGSFTPSPSLLLSQMSDPSAVLSTLCGPFLKREINPESFGISLVRSLIPNIKKSLLNRDPNAFSSLPRLVKLSIDNLGEDGLSLVTNEILPQIIELYLVDHTFIDLYCESVSSIPARFRDDVLVDSITKNSISADPNMRILAASIISLVRRYNRVIPQFMALSADPNADVRIAIVKALPNCNFDSPVIESIVKDAANDVSVEVRRAISEVIGYVAPYLQDTYIKLFEDVETQESALSSLGIMTNFSGFEFFYDTFVKSFENFPDTAATTLLQITSFIDPSEHRLLYKCAKKLRTNITFIKNFYQFTRAFENRDRFLKFFSDESYKDVNVRIQYCIQAQLFIDDFGIKLVPYALAFACDKSRTVRKQSVNVLIELIKKVPESKSLVLTLKTAPWMQRVVLAQLAKNLDKDPDFQNIIESLKNDRDERVRGQFNCEK